MLTKDIIAKVSQFVAPIIDENNYELVDVEFVKEGSNYYLRLFVDKEGGFSISDCEKVSRFLEPILEKHDIIDKAYILEVSSPGIDRILKHDFEFVKYKDRTVDVKLFKPMNDCKQFSGKLVGLFDGNIRLDIDGEIVDFVKKDVASCRLSVFFDF